MKVAFITAGPIEFASSRMRAHWVAPHIPDSTIQEYDNLLRTQRAPMADAYIFQKKIDPTLVKQLQMEHGATVWWDVCDPAWWWQPKLALKILDVVDGIVASNQALADDLTEFGGREVHVIPDRLNLDHFHTQREHHDTSPVRFIWFGLYCNRVALASAWINLVRVTTMGHPVTLTIMDDHPEKSWVMELGSELPIAYMHWRLDAEVDIIAQHDVALLPPYPGPWGKVKSDNKATTAWACGLPVVGGELDQMLAMATNWEERTLLAKQNRRTVENIDDVRLSAADWQELLGC